MTNKYSPGKYFPGKPRPGKPRILALTGGVGGAKLAYGLSKVVPAGHLSLVVNTADDFEYLGLNISPDLDTLTYTLAELNNKALGWGLANESWHCHQQLSRLSEAPWFQLGDRDLATHLYRTNALKRGASLTQITKELTNALGVSCSVIPMTDDPVRTYVSTVSDTKNNISSNTENQETLAFQDYFVRRQCQPEVRSIWFEGINSARPNPEFMAQLDDPDLGLIVICPSNPYLSIDPILSLKGVTEKLQESRVPVVSVLPIIGGHAVKGPTAKLMAELGMDVSAETVIKKYQAFCDLFIADYQDKALLEQAYGDRVRFDNILMKDDRDKTELAKRVLAAAGQSAR